ncbi:MAG: hypothetical protein RLZZ27_591, partial [Actinomycetota bacterium]
MRDSQLRYGPSRIDDTKIQKRCEPASSRCRRKTNQERCEPAACRDADAKCINRNGARG